MIVVHLNQIKGDGLLLEGQEPADILELGDGPPRQLGPVDYRLEVDMNGDGLWAVGEIRAEIELECVHTLIRFPYSVHLTRFATQLETTGVSTVDLTPMVREDILLDLPAYPDCERDGNIPRAHLLPTAPEDQPHSVLQAGNAPKGTLATFPNPSHPHSHASQADSPPDSDPPSPWETLDELKIERDGDPAQPPHGARH